MRMMLRWRDQGTVLRRIHPSPSPRSLADLCDKALLLKSSCTCHILALMQRLHDCERQQVPGAKI